MDGSVVLGITRVVAISLAPVVIVGAFLHAGDLLESTRLLARRLHLVRPPPLRPDGPPLETLAATLRRLRPRVHTTSSGTARQRGITAAYDGSLVATAKALDVATSLAELPEGLDRELERLRLEDALERAGLRWQPLES